jgi:serine O-acetyltransferase
MLTRALRFRAQPSRIRVLGFSDRQPSTSTAWTDLAADCLRYDRTPRPWNIAALAVTTAGFRAALLYRVAHWLRRRRLAPFAALAERVMHHACHCWISGRAEIGPGFLIAHVGGIVIGAGVRIGQGCDIRQNVTMGGNYSKTDAHGRQQPTVGDRVSVGAGAVILGAVTIGDDAVIGANAVVSRDIPARVIAAGVPARVIKPRWESDAGRKL